MRFLHRCVGIGGFEPPTSRVQDERPSRLAYTPLCTFLSTGVFTYNHHSRTDRTRTCNRRFWRPLLFQLSYLPKRGFFALPITHKSSVGQAGLEPTPLDSNAQCASRPPLSVFRFPRVHYPRHLQPPCGSSRNRTCHGPIYSQPCHLGFSTTVGKIREAD